MEEKATDWFMDAMERLNNMDNITIQKQTKLADNGIMSEFNIEKFREFEGHLVDLQEELENLESRVTLLGFANVFLFALAAIFAVAIINK